MQIFSALEYLHVYHMYTLVFGIRDWACWGGRSKALGPRVKVLAGGRGGGWRHCFVWEDSNNHGLGVSVYAVYTCMHMYTYTYIYI